MDINQVIHDAIGNGGGTYNVTENADGSVTYYKDEAISGYYVSMPFGVENFPYLLPSVVSAIVNQRHLRHAVTPRLGLWRDENGNWSIDQTLHTYDLFRALKWGVEYDQRAIWDVKNVQAVPVVGDRARL